MYTRTSHSITISKESMLGRKSRVLSRLHFVSTELALASDERMTLALISNSSSLFIAGRS